MLTHDQNVPGLQRLDRGSARFGSACEPRACRSQRSVSSRFICPTVAFTTSLAQQLVKKGIRVNAVAPRPVWTPLIIASKPPELLKKQESQPLKFGGSDPEQRPAQPAELAPAYVFLA